MELCDICAKPRALTDAPKTVALDQGGIERVCRRCMGDLAERANPGSTRGEGPGLLATAFTAVRTRVRGGRV